MRLVWLLVSLMLALLITPRGNADGPEKRTATADATKALIERLLRELDDEHFLVRQRAEAELTRIGVPAIPALLRTIKSTGSAEVRLRARRILDTVHRARLRGGFVKLAATKEDEHIDLLEGMVLISLIVDPLADREQVAKQLEGYAQAVRKKLGSKVDPAKANPQVAVKAIREVLFTDAGFTGNAGDFDNPDNSALSRVLATGRGLPILLSHVVVAVADRLEVPMVGLQIPYRYMVKYDGQRAPEGFPKQDIVVDAFDAGRIVTSEEVKAIIDRFGGGFDPERHLKPSRHRDTLARMLRNLVSDYEQAGLHDKATQAAAYLAILTPAEEQPAP